MKTFYFNTGVDYTQYPYLFGKQQVHGKAKVIPFDCDGVPDGSIFEFACDNPNLYPEADYIILEINDSDLISKYAYFSKTT